MATREPGIDAVADDSIKAAMRDATPTLTIPDSAFTFAAHAGRRQRWVGGTGGPSDIEKVTVDLHLAR